MRVLQSVIISALTLSTISVAMAQPDAAPAPIAPVTGDPVVAVPLDAAVRALIEMCTDTAGNARASFSEEQISRLSTLGFELPTSDQNHIVKVQTTAGLMMGALHERGSCLINSGPVDRATFAAAFSSAFDSSGVYARDSRPISPTGSIVASWRGQSVVAAIHQMNPGEPVVVGISRALDVRASR